MENQIADGPPASEASATRTSGGWGNCSGRDPALRTRDPDWTRTVLAPIPFRKAEPPPVGRA